ncbi:helix-turn-helix domain-containing protein [Weissella ceti]|uniref:Rep protein n=1 Tax=Weissella ceti TaxID=759620 RepID=A0A088GMI3_9LACO|nr:helix-turn-helix transcriptional regulator [Weissella ceti]AIM63114.1 Rep protein [Weissella ceti]
MTTVERIKEIAKKKNLNLKSTALKAGLGENTIYKWNYQKPNSDALTKVANVLGVSVDYLLGNTDETMPASVSKDTELDLDQALAEKGLVMKFNGKELSDKAKKGLLNVLEMWEEE